ncbi:hypothetical protein QBC43DRAFT_335025 [Cladorrhinum sp. PSN259]|nr:hypothetical protein QBC43DRAFT_335025 [Cladorrhinum sp. PSN259]
MFSTKYFGAAMPLGAAASSFTNVQETAQSVELTTVGMTTVTFYDSPATPESTTVTFTADASPAVISIITGWTIPASSIPITSTTLFINSSAADNVTTVVVGTIVPTANVTWAPAADATDANCANCANCEHSGRPVSSLAGHSASKVMDSKNAAAADTAFLIRRSLKAMAVGFLLALAL